MYVHLKMVACPILLCDKLDPVPDAILTPTGLEWELFNFGTGLIDPILYSIITPTGVGAPQLCHKLSQVFKIGPT